MIKVVTFLVWSFFTAPMFVDASVQQLDPIMEVVGTTVRLMEVPPLNGKEKNNSSGYSSGGTGSGMAGGTAAVRNGADHTSGAYDYGAAGRKGRCTDS